jgi:hypothetical protein
MLLALLRRDLVRLLWRPRSLLLLAYLGAASWAGASIPYVPRGNDLRPIGVALTDAIPNDFGSDWTLVAVQVIPLMALSTALIVEDRSEGGMWMTVHRAGGIRRWWSAKVVTALVLAALLVVVSALLVVVAATARGWDPTLAVSEYARAGPGVGYGRIGDTSPLVGTLIVVALRVIVLSVVGLFAVAIAVAIRRPALAYALPIILVLVNWRLTQGALPEGIALRADLLRQAFWDQHAPNPGISWSWTPVAVAFWMLAALVLGRTIVTRAEVTAS